MVITCACTSQNDWRHDVEVQCFRPGVLEWLVVQCLWIVHVASDFLHVTVVL